jgi:hypothetical protein
LAKSKTHSRSLVQRPVPWVAAASLQLRLRGAGALGSPKRTAAASNLPPSGAPRHLALVAGEALQGLQVGFVGGGELFSGVFHFKFLK